MAKFTSLEAAQRYICGAFETTGTSLMIIMHDFPYYLTCTRREACRLMKQGYELAPWVDKE